MKLTIDRSFLNFWTDKGKRVEAAHILDLCTGTLEGQGRAVTPFLGLAMKQWLENILQGTGLSFLSWGGFENAERVRFVLDTDSEPSREHAEISFIQATPQRKDCQLGHRDILGSLLGLGIEREVIGDIRQSAQGSIAVVTAPIADYILQNWSSVGRETIKADLFDLADSSLLPLAGVEKRIVSASPRLDTVAAAGFGISRSTMQEYIRQGRVKKNDLIILKPDVEVRTGDILSCRGEGKLKILEEDAKTRKGKSAWRIFIYQDVK